MFNNDLAIQEVNGEEEAYEVIEKELGIKPIRLGYMPSDMVFSNLTILNHTSVIEFEYKGKVLYLTCVSNSSEASINIKSDGKKYKDIYNKWLGKAIGVKKEITETGTIKYEASFADQDIVCGLRGELPEDEFIYILEDLHRFE